MRPTRAGAGSEAGERLTEILDIAADLFSTRGYSGTTMNDVADAAGVLPGSLYHHFDSKATIAVELLEKFNRDVRDLVSQIHHAPPPADPVAGITHLARAMARLSFQHRAAIRLRAYAAPTADSAQMDAALRSRIPSLTALWTERVKDLTSGSQSSGGLREGLDAGLLRFAMQYLTLNAGRGDGDHERYADDVVRVLLSGVVTSEYDDADLTSSPAHSAVRAVVRKWNEDRRKRLTDSRAGIIDAARQHFSLHGYAATTIRDVSSAAGVPMGSFYRRFDSKADLLREILKGYSTGLSQGLDAALNTPDTTPAQAFDALIVLLVDASRTWHHENRIARFEWSARGDTTVQEFYGDTVARQKRLESFLGEGQRAGVFATATPARRLAPLIRTVLWLPYHDQARSSRAHTQRFLRQTVIRGALVDG